MNIIVLIVLAAIGLTFVLKYSWLLNIPRDIVANSCKMGKEFVNCCMCMGFWSGFGLSLLSIFVNTGIVSKESVLTSMLIGFCVSLLAFFLDIMLQFLITVTNYVEDITYEDDVEIDDKEIDDEEQ